MAKKAVSPSAKSVQNPVRKGVSKESTATKSPRTFYYVLMPLFVVLWGFIYFEKGEIIALNNGCGWDGVTYKNVVWSLQWNKDTPENAERGRLKIDPYRVQRIAPSVAVYGEMQTAKYLYQRIIPLFSTVPAWLDFNYQNYPLPPWFFTWFARTPEEAAAQSVTLTLDSFIAGYFVFHSFFMLLGTAIFWVLIAWHLRLGFIARWLGFLFLFVNLAVMKMSFYYPTLTDTTALFVSTMMLYAYVADASWLLVLSAGIGFFTFPTAFPIAFLLGVFPRKYSVLSVADKQQSEQQNNQQYLSPKTAQILAFGATLFVLFLAIYFVLLKEIRFAQVEPVIGILLFCTIPLLLAQFYCSVWYFLRVFPLHSFLQHVFSREGLMRHGIRVGIGLVFWAGLWYCKKQIEDPTLAAPMNTDLFFGGSFSSAVTKPLLPIVSAAVYFGPVVAILLLRFRQFVETALELGWGYFFVIAILLIMATIMTETRQLINALPLFALGAAYMLKSAPLRPFSLGIVAAIGLFSSKIWLPFNFLDMAVQAADIQNGIYASFPLQYYFMNHGPWMSMTSYLVQGVALILCLGVFSWLFSAEFTKQKIQ